MGRSTGLDKRRTSRAFARSRRAGVKEKEVKHQRLIKFLEKEYKLKGLNDYQPMANHDDLVKDAVMIWCGHSGALFGSVDAYFLWKTTPEGQKFKDDSSYYKNQPIYWELATKAFVYHFRNLEKLPGPFYRGQSMRSGLPTDRMRSWSRNIKEAIDFSLGKPKIVGPNGTRDCPSISTLVYGLREGTNKVELMDGEKIVISLCVIEGEAEGFDLNATYLEQGRQEIIESLSRGESVSCSIKDGDSWKIETFSFEDVKKYLSEDIVLKLPQEEIKRLKEENPNKSLQEIITNQDDPEFSDIIKKTNDPEILKNWERAKAEKIKRVNDFKSIAPAHYHASEEEVIIHADESQGLKRLEIPVTDSLDEIRNLNREDIVDVVADNFRQILNSA